ncbi:MAG: ATP-binding cassette domain-containing protein [Bacteroidales bacterium]|nr:ATP-binding cassette domain-containing protein [Bacteroidales bacterium]
MNIIEVQDITKRFSNHVALDNVSLSVKEGVIFGLLGPNGAGKTTLIRILNQITFPDSGTVLFKGQPIKAEDVRQIGYLPEERGLYKKMKAGEQAMYLAQLKGLDRKTAYERLRVKFKQYDILDWWNRPVEELSKGMQQKLQFITTILHRPSFLILDEPFSGFDPINANLLKEEILKLKQEGTTIILSTHNMASVEEICDEIALINQSQKILEGNIYDIKMQFKKNIYSIEVQEENLALNSLIKNNFELLEQRTLSHSTQYDIRIAADLQANDLLGAVMPFANITAFREVLPSMNEIFIEQVETFNKEHRHEK